MNLIFIKLKKMILQKNLIIMIKTKKTFFLIKQKIKIMMMYIKNNFHLKKPLLKIRF